MNSYEDYNLKNKKNSSLGLLKFIGAAAILIIAAGIALNTAWGKRWIKSMQSSWGDGIYREIIVYDAVGNQLQYDIGQFDIDYTSDRIMYDDENNLRHVIYFKDGLVIVNEIKPDERDKE